MQGVKRKIFFILGFLITAIILSLSCNVRLQKTNAMPFYGLSPKELCVRAEFYTSYTASSTERKTNIKLAASALNNCFVDVGAEFSFNRTVGERTVARGYKCAKIIFNGKFVDGVGGGVCQVSTTLYNAVLLSGLKITEYHAHTLPVSYIAPSFDAMVNSGSADLKFVNNTDNPIIINTIVDDATLKVVITGEPMQEKITRQSVVTGEIVAPREEEINDTLGEYPDLYEGERKVISYSKNGLVSEGYLVKSKDGKPLSVQKIRVDRYSAMRGLVVNGRAVRPKDNEKDNKTNLEIGDIAPNFLVG